MANTTDDSGKLVDGSVDPAPYPYLHSYNMPSSVPNFYQTMTSVDKKLESLKQNVRVAQVMENIIAVRSAQVEADVSVHFAEVLKRNAEIDRMRIQSKKSLVIVAQKLTLLDDLIKNQLDIMMSAGKFDVRWDVEPLALENLNLEEVRRTNPGVLELFEMAQCLLISHGAYPELVISTNEEVDFRGVRPRREQCQLQLKCENLVELFGKQESTFAASDDDYSISGIEVDDIPSSDDAGESMPHTEKVSYSLTTVRTLNKGIEFNSVREFSVVCDSTTKIDTLCKLIEAGASDTFGIFVNGRASASALAKQLKEKSYIARILHYDLNHAQSKSVIDAFIADTNSVLIFTDSAINCDYFGLLKLTTIINYEVPTTALHDLDVKEGEILSGDIATYLQNAEFLGIPSLDGVIASLVTSVVERRQLDFISDHLSLSYPNRRKIIMMGEKDISEFTYTIRQNALRRAEYSRVH